jgi:hypothetical protein
MKTNSLPLTTLSIPFQDGVHPYGGIIDWVPKENYESLERQLSDVLAVNRHNCGQMDVLEKQLAEAREALEDIARQKLPEEMIPYDADHADYPGAYETMVRRARAAVPSVEFCGGGQPELRAAYDDLDEPLPPKQCGLDDDESCQSCQ